MVAVTRKSFLRPDEVHPRVWREGLDEGAKPLPITWDIPEDRSLLPLPATLGWRHLLSSHKMCPDLSSLHPLMFLQLLEHRPLVLPTTILFSWQ